jgi:hypothetical protein
LVVLVCACNDIELITSIAAIVARSCFVMEPRKMIWKDTRKTRKPVGPGRPSRFPFAFSYRPKQL